MGSGNLLDLHRQEEAARKKAREEKARQARQAAIQVPGTPGVIPQPVCQRALLAHAWDTEPQGSWAAKG